MTAASRNSQDQTPDPVIPARPTAAPVQPGFAYGGQAVIEGVMIRGRQNLGLAIRGPDGKIHLHHEQLNTLYTGPIRRFPLARGVIVLIDTLVLGLRALQRSANMALADSESGKAQEISGWALALTLVVSLGLGVGVFFILPLLIVWAMDPVISSGLASEFIEGGFRLVILIAYIWLIGLLPDVKRVFAYHGAEHMAVHAFEAGLPLIPANVQKFGTPHPRCGTAFLLTVVLVSIIVFAAFSVVSSAWEWRILSRIVLIPVIAGISYEIIRFSGAHQRAWIGQLLSSPGLWLQRLTTRAPEDDQIEVAICALETAIAADGGREYEVAFGPRPPRAGLATASPNTGEVEAQSEADGDAEAGSSS